MRAFILMLGIFLAFYFAPLGNPRLSGAIVESFSLAQWYAREHMIFGLVPALFIAGAISAFTAKSAIMRYLGARAKRTVAYAVASVSGCVLAVCSCTILPLFAGIYSRGAGLGPAMTFLYAGPAINVIAIFLTARILGAQIGIARAVGAISFSIVIGLVMHLVFRKDEAERADETLKMPEETHDHPIGGTVAFLGAMVAVLVFANWADISSTSPVWRWVFAWRWTLTAAAGLAVAVLLVRVVRVPAWKMVVALVPVAALAIIFRGDPLPPFAGAIVAFSVAAATSRGDASEWTSETWRFARDILPLLLIGIMVVGFALGRPGHEGIIPRAWVEGLVGGNSLPANLVASVAGGLMYFCTMTEVPIVQGLLGAGMGKGPALAFLLAGPAVSLPNILILRRIVGTKKTLVYLSLVVVMATLTGSIFGLMSS